MNILSNYSPSILAIPAYQLLSLVPHAIALNVATKGQLHKIDNRNPRGAANKDNIKQKLDPDSFAYYERAEACSANGLEGAPLFYSSIVLGHLAGLEQSELNSFAGGFLAIRVLYTIFYLNTRSNGPSYLRSGSWLAGVAMCFGVLAKSAAAFSRKTL